MFKTLGLLFNKKNKDIRQRVLFTLGCLMVFIVGKTIPVPGTQGAISSLGLWELYNAISGGGLEQFSIFALGGMPYISASLITGRNRKWCINVNHGWYHFKYTKHVH